MPLEYQQLNEPSISVHVKLFDLDNGRFYLLFNLIDVLVHFFATFLIFSEEYHES
jgi:hypothetical protein